MTQTAEQIIAAALTLPAEVKVQLAEQLLDSLKPTDRAEIDEAWIAEARRRLRDLDEGRAHTIPADEVFRRLDAQLRS